LSVKLPQGAFEVSFAALSSFKPKGMLRETKNGAGPQGGDMTIGAAILFLKASDFGVCHPSFWQPRRISPNRCNTKLCLAKEDAKIKVPRKSNA